MKTPVVKQAEDGIATQEVLLYRIADRIRQSLELDEILSATVAEVRAYLGTDRVKIYQFNPDGAGVVIAESVCRDRLPSLLGLNFPADDIPPYARSLFVSARQRAVVDLASHQIGLSPLSNPVTGDPLDYASLRYRPVDPCHLEYLRAMGVQSSVVVPIVLADSNSTLTSEHPTSGDPQETSGHLWGLLASHHADAHVVTEDELQLIQAIVDQVTIAISHSILLQQVRHQAQQEAHINRVTALLLHTNHAVVPLQAALEETVRSLAGSSGRLYLQSGEVPAELYTYGEQPQTLNNDRPIEENLLWQNYLRSTTLPTTDSPTHNSPAQSWSVPWMRAVYNLTKLPQGDQSQHLEHNLWSIPDLYKEPLLRTIAPYYEDINTRGLMIIPLRNGTQVLGCLTIGRDQFDTEISWAGLHDPDTRQLMARQSFEAWKQLKLRQIQAWTSTDIKLAAALGDRFSSAVKQYRLYQQVQALNDNLEDQVEARTQDLRKALSHLKSTQTRLIHNEKMSSLGQLVAGVAHEINNPVTFISGNLNPIHTYMDHLLTLIKLYQNEYPQPSEAICNQEKIADLDFMREDLPKLLDSLRVGAFRISEIVVSLRNFSRLDESSFKAVDVHEGLDSTLMILRHRTKSSSPQGSVKLVKHYGELPLVECLAGQLNQVFMHLLANAIDAVQENRKQADHKSDLQLADDITITTELIDSNWIRITIQDMGIGIPSEIKSKLFDPFFTTKPIGKGTGLGLSISDQIVQKHGGQLECDSKVGEGSRFWLEIPIKHDRALTTDPIHTELN